MAQDRDGARLRIARDGLTPAAIECVAGRSFNRLPITLVDRARTQLRRFFSDGPWTAEDDALLSALVGPGEGWVEEEFAPGIRVSFGWRGGAFRVDAETNDDDDADHATPDTEPTGAPVHERTVGDTFDEVVVVEDGRSPAELRFATGPGTGTVGRFTRTEQGNSASVAALFREFDEIESVRVDRGVVSVALGDPSMWLDLMLPMFDTITAVFVPPRSAPSDRQYERAIAELSPLDVGNPRDLARILDATTSPDAAYRRVAVAKLETADAIVVRKPWTRALEDSSRAVRRAAMRTMAHAALPDLRALLERALVDKDPCVRYYAVRGLALIGIERAEQSVDRRSRDDDPRVRIAAESALAGRIPR